MQKGKRTPNPLRSSFLDRDWSKVIEIIGTEKIFDKFLNRARHITIEGKTDVGNRTILDIDLKFAQVLLATKMLENYNQVTE